MMIPSIIGTIGVALLLVAFFLNLFKKIDQNSKLYILLNITGAGLAAYYGLLLDVLPFFVLESVWAIFAAYKLIIISRNQSKLSHNHKNKKQTKR